MDGLGGLAKLEAMYGRPGFRFVFWLYFAFKVLPIGVGAFALYLGYRLFILGVTGQASISVDAKTVGGQLLNAAPGLFFAVGGVVIIVVAIVRGVSLNFGDGGTNILNA